MHLSQVQSTIYEGDGVFSIRGEKRRYKKIGCLAGGTGVTIRNQLTQLAAQLAVQLAVQLTLKWSNHSIFRENAGCKNTRARRPSFFKREDTLRDQLAAQLPVQLAR